MNFLFLLYFNRTHIVYIAKKNLLDISKNDIKIYKKYVNYSDEMFALLNYFIRYADIKIIDIFIVFEVNGVYSYTIKSVVNYDKLYKTKSEDFNDFIYSNIHTDAINSGLKEITSDIEFIGFEIIIEDSISIELNEYIIKDLLNSSYIDE